MYQGSERYFVGMFVARIGFLWGIAATVNTGFQLFFLISNTFFGNESSPEIIAVFIEKWVFIMLPILPPITATDIANILFNILIMISIAGVWTLAWSEGMKSHHGR